METETIYISLEEYDSFKQACEKTYGIELLSYSAGEAKVSYKFASSLYGLGRIHQLRKNEY